MLILDQVGPLLYVLINKAVVEALVNKIWFSEKSILYLMDFN